MKHSNSPKQKLSICFFFGGGGGIGTVFSRGGTGVCFSLVEGGTGVCLFLWGDQYTIFFFHS
jgi:hypothetical protein